MAKSLPIWALVEVRDRHVPLARGIGWGFAGGLAGTLVMDCLLMGALWAIKQPVLLCFSIVGDTVSLFLMSLGFHVAGGIPAGVITHYLVGPLVGAFYGAIVAMRPGLRGTTLKMNMFAAAVYVEVLSQPILALAPIFLRMTIPETLQWFSGAFLMHLVLGAVLGTVVKSGLQPSSLGIQNR